MRRRGSWADRKRLEALAFLRAVARIQTSRLRNTFTRLTSEFNEIHMISQKYF
jgi:hypothetical protein